MCVVGDWRGTKVSRGGPPRALCTPKEGLCSGDPREEIAGWFLKIKFMGTKYLVTALGEVRRGAGTCDAPCGIQSRAPVYLWDTTVQPTADRVAQNLEIISKTLSTYQNSAHGIYD